MTRCSDSLAVSGRTLKRIPISPRHTAETCQPVFDRLASFRDALLNAPADHDRIAEEVKSVTLDLNAINRANGGELLETDERDIIVSFLIDAAAAAGLDVDAFEDGDPTLADREF